MKRLAAKLLRGWWHLRGGRSVRTFGHICKFTAETDFPIRRQVKLPVQGPLSNIVRYADLVQFHAACRFLSELRRPPVVVDVGAHHGTYAIVLGKLVQKAGGVLIAIEPNPESVRVLRENVRMNDLDQTVQCEQAAVMDVPGETFLDLNGSQSHVANAAGAQGVRVSVTTLRHILARYAMQRVDLLLVDVEGAELPVLKGFPWGDAELDWVLCEMHPYAWAQFGYDGRAMAAFLQERGYRCIDTYLKEHTDFPDPGYIGPTRLLKAVPDCVLSTSQEAAVTSS